MTKHTIRTEKAAPAVGPYAQGIRAGGLVFASGQLPIDPATGAFPEGVEAQTRRSSPTSPPCSRRAEPASRAS